ncbi:MAG: hypothetical protein K5821_05910 [Nitrobacter sp.]|nr:hypothetical protein [Nitrobacter sp.]MCV0385954.1 hypothetical protein [Nitrobacter sp.]
MPTIVISRAIKIVVDQPPREKIYRPRARRSLMSARSYSSEDEKMQAKPPRATAAAVSSDMISLRVLLREIIMNEAYEPHGKQKINTRIGLAREIPETPSTYPSHMTHD